MSIHKYNGVSHLIISIGGGHISRWRGRLKSDSVEELGTASGHVLFYLLLARTEIAFPQTVQNFYASLE